MDRRPNPSESLWRGTTHEAAAIEALKMALKVQPDDADTIAALRALGA